MTTRRALGAVLVVLAAGLAVAATFMTLQFFEIAPGISRIMRYEETAWEVSRNDFPGPWVAEPPRLGYPIITGAVLLAVGAVLNLRVPPARYAALIGAGLVAGGMWGAYEHHLATIARFAVLGGEQVEILHGSGMLTLGIATAAGLLGAVAMQEFPQRVKPPEPPAGDVVIHQLEDDDSETPPYGFPVVVEEPKK